MTTMSEPALASPSNPRIKAAARLRERRERDKSGLTLVDGARELRRALEAGVEVVEAFICEPLVAGEDARVALDGLRSRNVAVTTTTEAAFAKLAFGDRAEGLVAVVRAPSLALADLALPARPADRRHRRRREARQPRSRAAQRGRRRRRRADRRLAADRPREPERHPGERRHDLHGPDGGGADRRSASLAA